MSTALLIIDVQHALCTGEYAAFDSDRVIERINTLSAQARAAHAPVVLIQHEENDGPLRFDTAPWQLAEGLTTSPSDLRVRKTTPDSFHRTDLTQLLQARDISHLVICGLQSDFCVDTTTRRALALGYEVTLVEDAHSTVDNGVLTAAQITAHHNVTLANMTSFGKRATVIPAADVRIQA
ncbi:cysteine hydrolase family protein [Ectopseudomonas khazarica]|uniref:cysteine hydrolase family protein n=1 Tax=Ectopseudomonas khazarica TaxID=2502979 RepID=UPI0037C6F2DA